MPHSMTDPETNQLKALLQRNASPQKLQSSCPYRFGQRTISYVSPEIMQKLRESRVVVENGVAKVVPNEPDVILERGMDLVVLPVGGEADKGSLMIDGKRERLRKWQGIEDIYLGYKVAGGRKKRERRDFGATQMGNGMRRSSSTGRVPKRRQSGLSIVEEENIAFALPLSSSVPTTINGGALRQSQRDAPAELTTHPESTQRPSSRSSSRLANHANPPITSQVSITLPKSTRIRNNPTTKRQTYDDRPKSKYVPTHTHSPPKKLFNRSYFHEIENQPIAAQKRSNAVVHHDVDAGSMFDAFPPSSEDASVRSIQLSSDSSWAGDNLPTERRSARSRTAPKLRPSTGVSSNGNSALRRKRKALDVVESQPISIPSTAQQRMMNRKRTVTPLSPVGVGKTILGASTIAHHNLQQQQQQHTTKDTITETTTNTLSKPNITNRISVNLTIKEPEPQSPSSPKNTFLTAFVSPVRRRHSSASTNSTTRLTKSSVSVTNASPLHSSHGRKRSNSDKLPGGDTTPRSFAFTRRSRATGDKNGSDGSSLKVQVKIRNAPRGVTLPSPLVSP